VRNLPRAHRYLPDRCAATARDKPIEQDSCPRVSVIKGIAPVTRADTTPQNKDGERSLVLSSFCERWARCSPLFSRHFWHCHLAGLLSIGRLLILQSADARWQFAIFLASIRAFPNPLRLLYPSRGPQGSQLREVNACVWVCVESLSRGLYPKETMPPSSLFSQNRGMTVFMNL